MCLKRWLKFQLTGSTAYIMVSGILMLSFNFSHAQIEPEDEWDIPWTTVGDSTETPHENSKIVVTGTVTNVDTNEPVSGASVSFDFFKYFDYTDQDGRYVLEVPPGKYKVRIKHIGMLPVYLDPRGSFARLVLIHYTKTRILFPV